jgi:hypothetical protein
MSEELREYTFINSQARMLGTSTGLKLMPGKNVFKLTEHVYRQTVNCQQFKNWCALGWVSYKQPEQVKAEALELARKLTKQKKLKEEKEAAKKKKAEEGVVDLTKETFGSNNGTFVPEAKADPKTTPGGDLMDPADTLKNMTVPEAEKVIADCSDGELLATWYDNDSRKGVKQAAAERLKELDLLPE